MHIKNASINTLNIRDSIIARFLVFFCIIFVSATLFGCSPQESCLIDYSNYTISECNEVQAMVCNAYCIDEAQIGNNDYTVCDTLENYRSRYELCYGRFAALAKDVAICDKIPSEESQLWKNTCYSQVAATLKDTSLCNQISYPDHYDNCISAVATAQQNATTCLLANRKIDCFYSVTKAIKDPTICANYMEGNSLEYCYCYVGEAAANASICDKSKSVSFIRIRENCYRAVAAKLNDTSICEKITDSGLKKSCRIWVKVQIFKRELYWENKAKE